MIRKALVAIVIASLVVFCSTPVFAQDTPKLPHAFYGTLTLNGSPAPVGTRVQAAGEGVLIDIEGNPIRTDATGRYGSTDPLEQRLIVQGDIEEGTLIYFYVNGNYTGQTAEWHSGSIDELDLTAATRAGAGAGIGAAPPIEGTAEIFGVESIFTISEEGEILETIEATSEEGDFTITIPEGTIALDEYGDPLETLEIDVDDSPPDPPEEAHIIGLAYDLGPDGATFDPAITVEFTYDPDDLPEDIDEGDLVIAFYNEDANEWVELVCVVDTVNNTITAEVEHFTTFTVIAPPPPVAPPPVVLAPAAFTSSALTISPLEVDVGETVTIRILVSNTGEEEGSYTITLKINEVVEETKEITLAGGDSETVTFTTSKDEAGTYLVDVDGLTGSFTVQEVAAPPPVAPPTAPPEVKPEINWPVVGGVIAGVIVVGLVIFFVVVHSRRAY